MDTFLPVLNSNNHDNLLKDSVRSCILNELAQVQKETDEQDTKYKHVASEVTCHVTGITTFFFFYCKKY